MGKEGGMNLPLNNYKFAKTRDVVYPLKIMNTLPSGTNIIVFSTTGYSKKKGLFRQGHITSPELFRKIVYKELRKGHAVILKNVANKDVAFEIDYGEKYRIDGLNTRNQRKTLIEKFPWE